MPSSLTAPVPAMLSIASVTTPSAPTTLSAFVATLRLLRYFNASGRVSHRLRQADCQKPECLEPDLRSEQRRYQRGERAECEPDTGEARRCGLYNK